MKKSAEVLLEIEQEKVRALEHQLYRIVQVLYGSRDIKDIAEITLDTWVFDNWLELLGGES